jgi:hypothetical protein
MMFKEKQICPRFYMFLIISLILMCEWECSLLEPTISAGERPQIYALDRATTGSGINFVI